MAKIDYSPMKGTLDTYLCKEIWSTAATCGTGKLIKVDEETLPSEKHSRNTQESTGIYTFKDEMVKALGVKNGKDVCFHLQLPLECEVIHSFVNSTSVCWVLAVYNCTPLHSEDSTENRIHSPCFYGVYSLSEITNTIQVITGKLTLLEIVTPDWTGQGL